MCAWSEGFVAFTKKMKIPNVKQSRFNISSKSTMTCPFKHNTFQSDYWFKVQNQIHIKYNWHLTPNANKELILPSNRSVNVSFWRNFRTILYERKVKRLAVSISRFSYSVDISKKWQI